MGYNAVQLEWGTMGWTKNDVAPGPGHALPRIAAELPGRQDAAQRSRRPGRARSSPPARRRSREILDRARRRRRGGRPARVSMTAEAVQGLLTDTNPANDPFVVDARKPGGLRQGPHQGRHQHPGGERLPGRQPRQAAAGPAHRGRRLQRPDRRRHELRAVDPGLQRPRPAVRHDGLEPGTTSLMAPFKRFPADQKDLPDRLASLIGGQAAVERFGGLRRHRLRGRRASGAPAGRGG
ncbi:MAG: hypothetical protein MZW92_28890 [Comamonadaceae bacterium]|nr:hypothetical protein [Comamonadaceae bacterium]